MYEEHFGLSKNPFQSIAEGEAVFEGSAQTKVIADLKTALTAKDSIAVITGPVGVGKTTIVQRAMEQMGPEQLIAILGRTQVGSDELVDVLLAQFGVVREPTRRFECLKTFNRILNERAAAGARVFIIIEDAERLGAELLEELEALTAADGGACAGANIVLMGPQKLDKLVAKPALERVRQRIRLQRTLERYTADEVESYLRHRINAAGGDFDAMFEAGASLMVRRCSGGIPRVVNSLCETALTVAAEGKISQVSGKIVFKVAVEVFGMSPGDSPASQVSKVTPPPKPTAPAAKPPAAQQSPAPSAAEATPPQAAAPTAAAANKPAPVAKKPASVAARPAAANDKNSEPTIRVPKMSTAPEPADEPRQSSAPRAPKPPANAATPPAKPAAPVAKSAAPVAKPAAPVAKSAAPVAKSAAPAANPVAPAAANNGAAGPSAKPKAEPSRLPDLPGLGVQDKAPAAAATKPAADKPLPELPPKFKFADEIVVDRDTKPRLPVQPPKQVEPPELPTLELGESAPKIADEKPQAENAPVPPSAATDIPTLGESAVVKKVTVKPAPKPAAAPATPAPPKEMPELTLEEPSPPADRSEPPDIESTASFAKVDHDMLDAALADLAVHDEKDKPKSVEAEMIAAADEPAPASIPQVTLDKSIETKRLEATAATDSAVLSQMAAELEKAESLEDVSDQLAETLFGNEELEAISLQIREQGPPVEESPVALEPAEAIGAADTADTTATPKPDVTNATAQPAAAPEPPAATMPTASQTPIDNIEMSTEQAAAPSPPPKQGPQPEPIESQINTSITATLKTLSTHNKPQSDDDDTKQIRAGFLGRLKDTFKS